MAVVEKKPLKCFDGQSQTQDLKRGEIVIQLQEVLLLRLPLMLRGGVELSGQIGKY